MTDGGVPAVRIEAVNRAEPRPAGEYVLYWMTANRRTRWNFALDRAVEHAVAWRKPLLIFEALRCDFRWASDRFHRFVLQGMADRKRRLAGGAVHYYPYVEPAAGADHGLLAALAERACLVVADDFPTFFLPRMLEKVAASLPVRVEKVDANGLYPMKATTLVFARAYDFRRHLQKQLRPHLDDFPREDPLAGLVLPPVPESVKAIERKWPPASDELLEASPAALAKLPIDHAVGPAVMTGGETAAEHTLKSFLQDKLDRYGEERNDPDADVASGLSPYLHFGHVGAHQVFAELIRREGWNPSRLPDKGSGQREGWWGMRPAAEGFLDEFITWRELGYNFCSKRRDYDRYSSLPVWARETLAEHAADPRPEKYAPQQMEQAGTRDAVWNAAQRQLLREGRMHNYLRMLWGKKILEWSPSPEEALQVMIELNNKYAVDGRNPNSYSGIFWVLGRYDRAWGPERPIFGKIRYMSSDNTVRKLHIEKYLAKYGPAGRRELFSTR